MDLNGFIKIDRKIQKWEWYDDLNMCGFFLHLLLLANWEDRRWHGIVIKRGSFVTSYRKLADSMHVSSVTIYKWIKRLTETGELTVTSTSRYTVISIVSYDFYQSKKTEKETQKKYKVNTEETQSKHELYTTEEHKNNNNNNNKNSSQEKEIFSPELVAQWATEWHDPFGAIIPMNYYTFIEGMQRPNRKKKYFESWCRNVKHLVKISELNEATTAAPVSQGTSGTLQKRSAEEMSDEEWLTMMAEQEKEKSALQKRSEEGGDNV